MSHESHDHSHDEHDHEHEIDHDHDESCTCINWDKMYRMYRVALADFRLFRGEVIWPKVAAVVDAAFVLGDPIHASDPGGDPNTHLVYEDVAVRVWTYLISEMFDSLGTDQGTMRLTEGRVRDIVGEQLIQEFQANSDGVDDFASEVEFADIINREFGVTIPVGTPAAQTAAPAGTMSETGARIDWDRVDLMVRLIHGRLAEFPWETEPF